jgi:hypothetical protein
MKARTALMLCLLAAPGQAQVFERDLARLEELAKQAQEEQDRRREAIRKSCEPIIAREKAGYAQAAAQAQDQGRKVQGELLHLLVEFRQAFSAAELRFIKEANAQRKRLYAVGVKRSEDGLGLHGHWEARIAEAVRPKYRAFAPRRKHFQCAPGVKPVMDFEAEPSKAPSESEVPHAQRNVILPPPGLCDIRRRLRGRPELGDGVLGLPRAG